MKGSCKMKEKEFLAELKEIELIGEAIRLLGWDENTGMPEGSNGYRGEVTGYLNKKYFEKNTSKKIADFLTYFDSHQDELTEVGLAAYKNVKENYELNHKIEPERMEQFYILLTKAYADWVESRKANDYGIFAGSLNEIIETIKEFIPKWRKDEKTPYDVLLNQSEPEMTTEVLDVLFAEVKAGIMNIRKAIEEKGSTPRTDFLSRTVTKEQQRKFVMGVAEQLGYDFSRGRLDDTVHPFMIRINRKDARITTRWNENDFAMATFGVIHEAGHGIYEQNIDEKYDYTPLATGTSMGIHESQSLFNEIIIGSNKSFWQKQYPFFQECTEGTFADIDFETFYASLKQTKASFVRIEADSLTYPLHIIIRYEIEKMIFNEDLPLEDLPKVWNDKYEEYLGIRPETDLEGILQDVHWSGGSFGYFPSYALGYMYAAQLLNAMKKELNVDEILGSEDYSPIRKWLTKHIHQYGASRKPNQLIMDATGEPLTSSYLIDYLRTIYFDVYQID